MHKKLLVGLLCLIGVVEVALSNPIPIPVGKVWVSFDAGGGTGSMSGKWVKTGLYVLPKCSFTKIGYAFDGWRDNDYGAVYSAGQTIQLKSYESRHFVATWREVWIDRAMTWTGMIVDSSYAFDYDVNGIVLVKATKPNAKSGVSKVTAKITLSTGQIISMRGETSTGSLTLNGGGSSLYLGLNSYGMYGDFSGVQTSVCSVGNVLGSVAGGNIYGTKKFECDIPVPKGLPYWWCVPYDVPVVSVGTKWVTPSGKVVIKNKIPYEVGENPCGVKLTRKNTGEFSGSFTAYEYDTDSSTGCITGGGKIKYKVTGIVYDGIGFGFATARGKEPANIRVH